MAAFLGGSRDIDALALKEVYQIETTLLQASGPFLDVHLRVQPADDFCGAQKCNITYALSVLSAHNQYDLQSLMLQEGTMTRNERYFFEDSTVIRLTEHLRTMGSKVYLGLMLFDLPDDIQDYFIVEVTDAIRKDRKVKVEFSSETARIGVRVHQERGLVPVSGAVDDASDGPQDASCKCVKRNCGCCEHMTVPKIHLNDSVCVNVTYIAADIGVQLSLSVDQHVYITREVSLRNPPPICYEVPHLREYASLCIRLYNIDVSREEVAGCSEVEAKLYHVSIARVKIGCFRIPI